MPISRPVANSSGWSAPTEEDCPQVQRNVINAGPRRRIRQVCGYFNGEFSYFDYDYAELIEGREVIFARIWTAAQWVLHVEFDEHGAEVRKSVVADLTCQEDVVKTHSDAAKLAMSYLNTHPEGR